MIRIKANLDIVAEILKKKSEGKEDTDIKNYIRGIKEYSEEEIEDAFEAIDKDVFIVITTIPILNPISPMIFRLGAKKIEKETRVAWGIFRNITEYSIRTIEKVDIIDSLISAEVIIRQEGNIKSKINDKIVINHIKKKYTKMIKRLYCEVINSQRKPMIGILTN